MRYWLPDRLPASCTTFSTSDKALDIAGPRCALPPSPVSFDFRKASTNNHHSFAAFTSATVLLYYLAQMQIHGYTDSEWKSVVEFVGHNLAILAYCRELDPVADNLGDTLSQYAQTLTIPARSAVKLEDNLLGTGEIENLLNESSSQKKPAKINSVEILLSVKPAPKGFLHTSAALRRLVCMPFNSSSSTSPTPTTTPPSASAGANTSAERSPPFSISSDSSRTLVITTGHVGKRGRGQAPSTSPAFRWVRAARARCTPRTRTILPCSMRRKRREKREPRPDFREEKEIAGLNCARYSRVERGRG